MGWRWGGGGQRGGGSTPTFARFAVAVNQFTTITTSEGLTRGPQDRTNRTSPGRGRGCGLVSRLTCGALGNERLVRFSVRHFVYSISPRFAARTFPFRRAGSACCGVAS